jgi:hypothetical protein
VTQEIIPFNGDRNHLIAQWPSAVPGVNAKLAIAKAIAKAAETAVHTLAQTRYAIVKVLNEHSLQVELLNEQWRVIREDVIPVMATYTVHNQARRTLAGMRLDPDLDDAAREDLDRALERRRGRQ